MAKDQKPITTEELLTQAVALLAQNVALLSQQNAILTSVLATAQGVRSAAPPADPVVTTKPAETTPQAQEPVKTDKPTPAAVEAEKTRPNGKKASPEDMIEEVKKLVPKLAELTSRDEVVKILSTYKVSKATEIPVEKLPEFVATLKAAIAKAS